MGYREHSYIKVLKQKFAAHEIDRREFLRSSTLLGLSAAAAYSFAFGVSGQSAVSTAFAQELPKGGTLRLGMRVKAVDTPHAFDWVEKSNVTRGVAEYLTRTDADNVTRPYLLEGWEPSEDLRTWTLKVRKAVKWQNGRDFVADDVIWNLKHVLDPNTGSSLLGLMKGYMLNDEGTAIWDANAIEKVDDFTVRLNLRSPQLAVPEHFFHYPFAILDPEEGGKFGPGSNGTGPFELVEIDVGRRAVLKNRGSYWGRPAHLDTLEFIDFGDDAMPSISALASRQIDGLYGADASRIDILRKIAHAEMYIIPTSETGVVRGKVSQKPFDDPRVRKALRLCINQQEILTLALRDLGIIGEHHHVAKVHPEYAKLPLMIQDIEQAKKLLSEAGYAQGLKLELNVNNSENWQVLAAQGMVQQWKKAGINVDLKPLPGAQFWENWDKVPFGFTTWYHRPLAIMNLALAYRTGVVWNESEYSNPEFDQLLTQAEGLVDVDKRREVMSKIEAIMQEDGPIVQPVFRSTFTFMDKRVKGFKMHPTNYIFPDELAIES